MVNKKSFKEGIEPMMINPAMQIINPQGLGPAEEEPRAKRKPKESKSKRLQLLMKPSLYELIKERAEQEGCSVNEFIHNTMEEALK